MNGIGKYFAHYQTIVKKRKIFNEKAWMQLKREMPFNDIARNLNATMFW